MRQNLPAIRTEWVVGNPADVRTDLAAARELGDLVRHGPERPLADGRIVVEARVIDRESQPQRGQLRLGVVFALVFLVLLVLGLAAYVVKTVLGAAAAAASALVDLLPAFVGLAAVLGLIAWALRERGCDIIVFHRRHR